MCDVVDPTPSVPWLSLAPRLQSSPLACAACDLTAARPGDGYLLVDQAAEESAGALGDPVESGTFALFSGPLMASPPTPLDVLVVKLSRQPEPISLTLGRASGQDLQVLDDNVSQAHATLACREGWWTLLDHESKNGTYLGGVRLSPGVPTRVYPGTMIRLGQKTLGVFVDRPLLLGLAGGGCGQRGVA